MKVFWHKTLAVALALGAAVLAGPVQALQCAHPRFWRFEMPESEMVEGMARFAAETVAEAQSIFKGHAVSVQFIGPDNEYPAFILTFKVTEWIKGDKKPYARIIYEGWCDGGCSSILEKEDEILYDHREKIYVADRPNALFNAQNPVPENIDGVFGLCKRLGRRIESVNETQPASRRRDRWFLLDLAMRNEIEKLTLKHRSAP